MRKLSKKKKGKHFNTSKKNSRKYRKEQNLKTQKQKLQNKEEILVAKEPEKILEQKL